ncbi:YjfB family protein [Thiomicrorhabdus sp.]|uniref:YjfB family protein n=1 Tax=Thiomicrorhabdus sp. TaxID=2039724 RepID=UPI002AA644FB|nr:YjfB family protein [Thiomicrorhabdus sp.]
MDISNVSVNGAVSAVLAQKEVYNQEQVSVGMLKKALDTQTQSALALIESIPQITPTTQGLPANLGNNINTTA